MILVIRSTDFEDRARGVFRRLTGDDGTNAHIDTWLAVRLVLDRESLAYKEPPPV